MAILTEFLTDIANAIRSKKGTAGPINAQNFASEIENIKGGSSGLVGYSGDIKYIDEARYILIDGTISETFVEGEKYAFIVAYNEFITTQDHIYCTNCIKHILIHNEDYEVALIQPTADNWRIVTYSSTGGGGGSND